MTGFLLGILVGLLIYDSANQNNNKFLIPDPELVKTYEALKLREKEFNQKMKGINSEKDMSLFLKEIQEVSDLMFDSIKKHVSNNKTVDE